MPVDRQSKKGNPRTGPKRTYQACAPCRAAKLRCDLGDPDAPNGPPCRRCLRTHRDCVFNAIYGREELSRCGQSSQRPKNVNAGLNIPEQGNNDGRAVHGAGPSTDSTLMYSPNNKTSNSPLTSMSNHHYINEDNSEAFRFARGEALENPADALRILRAAADEEEAPTGVSSSIRTEHNVYTGSENVGWQRWQPIVMGTLTADEARSLLYFYRDHLNPCHPLISPEVFHTSNLGQLLKESILLAVLIATAARYYNPVDLHEDGRLSETGSRTIRAHLMDWILRRLSFVAMGQNASIGTVEALLILSEWPPEPSALSDTGLLDPFQEQNDRSSPCKLYDDVSWALTGMAVRVAQKLDLQDERTYLDKSQPDWVVTRRYRTWTNCLSADRHASVRLSRASLMQEMSTAWYRTISGIGYLTGDTTFPLPRVHLSHREILSVVELTHIIGLLQELLYISPEVTQELIKTARFESTLHRLKPELDSLWQRQISDLPSYPTLDQNDEPFTADELRQVRWRMDHDYVKLYANSIAMRASQNRLLQRHKHKNREDRVFSANVIQSSEGSFIIEAVDAAISLVKCGVAMERKGVLKYCPNRVFLRLVFASVFLMKAMSFGAVAPPEQDTVDLQYDLIKALKAVAVDENHVASYLSTLLERVFPSIPTEPSRPSSDQSMEGPPLTDQSTLALFGFDTSLTADFLPQDQWTDMTGFGYDPSSIISDIEEMLAASTNPIQPFTNDMGGM
ncbi:hypothetical protein I302_109202 [Kwoniella bestiolae CBS 10118]|uniref:Zn(2)-C6 fungal-type domain-containing protein n=1 Tax=Kwoniella bestiolae CBS 10118 TaxID=1296100 RepID=A0A1B9FV98_9TREE|nr:hypothetical protein I302_08348 [Kwoniella bestiolae CBS 10118]OCF22697.1 hypothetical protein I302_08348 [Kwoniella bestiolae CBS 10118]